MNDPKALIFMGILLGILALGAAVPAIGWYCRRTARNLRRTIHGTRLGINTAAPMSGEDIRTRQSRGSKGSTGHRSTGRKYRGAGRRMV